MRRSENKREEVGLLSKIELRFGAPSIHRLCQNFSYFFPVSLFSYAYVIQVV